jgi:8-oxo-dGTP diphosphatase
MRREYPDRPFLGVGAIIVRDGKVLLARRGNPPLKGEWSIPGGLVELGETSRQAIVREVREETGLEVEPTKLVEVFERILRDHESRVEYHYVLIDYLCRIISGNARAASDVDEICWASVSDLENMSVAPETCVVIRKALEDR